MQLSPWRPVFEHQGPLLTVYLESQSPSEDAAEQVRKRWGSLRDRAANEGAGAAVLDAVEAALSRQMPGEVQADGRVIVAAPSADDDTAGTVLLDETWDGASDDRDDVHWGTLPDVGPLVRQKLRSVRVLVAVADQHGARVRFEVLSPENESQEREDTIVEGDSRGWVRKPRQGALAHNRIQRRADEAVKQNARTVAEYLTSAARRFVPRVLVLAGEVQGRTAIRDELANEETDICVEADRGGVEDDGAEQALASELSRIASEEVSRSQTAYADQFHESAAHELAVQGADSVAAAAEMGAVATLLLDPDRLATREALLLQACAVTDASVALVDPETDLEDGVGALLRFPTER